MRIAQRSCCMASRRTVLLSRKPINGSDAAGWRNTKLVWRQNMLPDGEKEGDANDDCMGPLCEEGTSQTRCSAGLRRGNKGAEGRPGTGESAQAQGADPG